MDIEDICNTFIKTNSFHSNDATSERRYFSLVEQLPAGLYDVNFHNLKFKFVNSAICRVLGYNRKELLEMSVLDLMDDEGRAKLGRTIEEWPYQDQGGRQADFTFYCKGGRAIHVLLNTRLIRKDDGSPSCFVGACYNITERKRIEDELQKADENKNRFMGTLAHEIKNPLTTISASLDLLAVSPTEELSKRTMAIMRRQVEQIKNLTDDLLDVSRVGQNKINLKRNNIDLNNVLADIASDTKASFEKRGIKLNFEANEQPIFVHADTRRITQVISNLLTNALKFSREDGSVWLTIKQDQNEAIIIIKDDGIGISSEMLPFLFKPFVQVAQESASHGISLGLGLAIVKGIIELHGGSIAVNSAGLGKGSEFIIRLPIAHVV